MRIMKKIKQFAFLVGFLMSIVSSGYAQQRWIAFDSVGVPQKVELQVVSCDGEAIVINAKVHGVFSQKLYTKGGEFTELSLPDYGYTMEIGKPQLPAIRNFIEIPYGAKLSVEVTRATAQEVSLADVGIAARIVPAQQPGSKNPDAIETFEIDEEFYQKDSYYHAEIVSLGSTGIMRGHRLLQIEIFPVNYNPGAGTLLFYPDITLKIKLAGSNLFETSNTIEKYWSPDFEKLVERTVLNYGYFEQSGALNKSASGGEISMHYLIITQNNFYDNILPLRNWKSQKKFKTTVTKLSQIPDQSNTGIRDYIRSCSPLPSYVLLVGDTGYIPNFTYSIFNIVTDLDYSLKDDTDYFPDIFVGRFSALNTSQTDAMVEKTVEYEKAYWSGGTDWIKKAAFIAGKAWEAGTPIIPGDFCEKTHTAVIGTYMDQEGYASDSLYAYSHSITKADISNAINDGRSIVTYAGHGEWNRWYLLENEGLVFSQDDVRSFTNVDRYPFVFSFCCLTGKFDEPECFGETWLRENDKAAVAFWGASQVARWEANSTLESSLFRAIFEDELFEFAGMTNRAKLYFYNFYHITAPQRTGIYYHMFNILGDPALELWTESPSALSADLTVTSTSVTVNASVGDVIITVCSDDFDSPTYHKSIESASGSETFTTSVRPLYVTVTRHNYIPYLAITGGTLTCDQTWSERLLVHGDIIVPSGISLTVKPGTSVTFAANSDDYEGGQGEYSGNLCELVIQGKLEATADPLNNPIYFKSSSNSNNTGEWYGIVFENSADDASEIKGCVIKNGEYGIYDYDTDLNIEKNEIIYNQKTGIVCNDHALPTIYDNYIRFNGNRGIWCYYHSSPRVRHNRISDHNSWGLVCSVLSAPHLDGESSSKPYGANEIVDNDSGGVLCNSGCYPRLGFGLSEEGKGMNTIVAETGLYEVKSLASGSMTAHFNWWGANGPYTYGNVETSDQLPGPYSSVGPTWTSGGGLLLKRAPSAGVENSSAQPLSLNKSPGNDEVNELIRKGFVCENEQDYEGAITAYRYVVDHYQANKYAPFCLSRVIACRAAERKEALEVSWLQSKATALADSPLGKLAALVLPLSMAAGGDFQAAITECRSVAQFYDKTDCQLVKGALFEIGHIYLFNMNDRQKAKAAFEELALRFPGDELLEDAEELLATYHGGGFGKKKQATDEDLLPSNYGLSQNFPNPANPSTTISFTLPEASHVRLEIYNLLGQRVRTLVQGAKPAGSHTAVWDGRDEFGKVVSSGIYLYHLKCHLSNSHPAGKADFVRVKKLLLIR